MITDKVITQIADQLGMATEHIYEVFVTAQPVLALLNIVCGITIVIFTIGGYILVKKYINEDDLPPAIGAMIGTLVGIFTSLWLHSTLVLMLLPEYSAITELMHLMI